METPVAELTRRIRSMRGVALEPDSARQDLRACCAALAAPWQLQMQCTTSRAIMEAYAAKGSDPESRRETKARNEVTHRTCGSCPVKNECLLDNLGRGHAARGYIGDMSYERRRNVQATLGLGDDMARHGQVLLALRRLLYPEVTQ